MPTEPLYADVADLEEHLGVSPGWDTRLLRRVLLAAEAKVEAFCGRSFIDQEDTVARVFRANSPVMCVIDDVTAVGTVETTMGGRDGTWTTFTLGDVVQETFGPPGSPVQLLAADNSWFPTGRGCWVRVTPDTDETWGWASVPDPVPAAVLLQAAKLFNRKDSPGGSLSGFQGVSVSTDLMDLGLDQDAASLLEDLVRFERWLP